MEESGSVSDGMGHPSLSEKRNIALSMQVTVVVTVALYSTRSV